MITINHRRLISFIAGAGLLAGCVATSPPSFAPGNPGDPQVRVPARPPANLLLHDETTVAIQQEFSRNESATKTAETVQHGDMKMENHKDTPPATNVEQEKKAVAEEMKKTSDEMKRTSEAMKKAEQTAPQNFYYTCQMHPQIHADNPGKCPICGMTLIKKEGAPPK
jgi:rubrerythrin